MKYPRYEKYKDSGVEWLGTVPEHWDVVRLGRYTKWKSGDFLSNEDYYKEVEDGYAIPVIGGNGISGWTEKAIFDKPLIIIGRVGALCGNVHYIIIPCWVSDNALVLSWSISFDLEFLSQFLKFLNINRFASQTAQPLITGTMISGLKVLLPPLFEQQSIADFLDRETTRIDALIEKKQKLIELLKEKRTALITRAVTKGLDPNVKMKDSGIDWLGEVPVHWEVKKLKYLARLKSGTNITSELIEESEAYPVYGGNGLRGFYSEYTHEGEYVLIGRQGALCGNINYASGKFWASEHAVVVSPLYDIQFFWLGELLRIMNLNQYSVSAAQPGLAVENIQRLYLPVPPINEQEEISTYLKQETETIDLLKDKINQAITKHQEYRTALISAAVTGKIKVTDIK